MILEIGKCYKLKKNEVFRCSTDKILYEVYEDTIVLLLAKTFNNIEHCLEFFVNNKIYCFEFTDDSIRADEIRENVLFEEVI